MSQEEGTARERQAWKKTDTQYHFVETQRFERKCVILQMRKSRSEELCDLPRIPQLHPEPVGFSWRLNLSHPSFQKTCPIYLWKMSKSLRVRVSRAEIHQVAERV